MIAPETLDFPPLHCSLEPRLGDFYQDFSAALTLVASGYHGGLDTAGVPLVRDPQLGSFHNPITVAQYALANLTSIAQGCQERGGIARIQLDWLVDAQQTTGEWAGCWLLENDDPKYPWLRAPWTSALASGNAISALLRGWETFGVDRYRSVAETAYTALHVERKGTRLVETANGDLWYEEYPADRPLHVLNGHVYALFGVLDYARVSGDPEAEERWRRAAATTPRHLPEFDLGYWSAYDLRWRGPTSLHYHKNIHVPQLLILAELTGEADFADRARRWRQQLDSALCRARRSIALRVQARRR